MTDASQKRKAKKAARIFLALAVAVLCVLLLALIGLKLYLSSSLPAPQLSRTVTSKLHQNFTVEALQLRGAALVLKGVRLQNPPGFPAGNVFTAESVTVAPGWVDLLRGRGRYRLIALQGIRVNLVKNNRGEWNFGHLRRELAARKPSPTETFVKELVVKDGALTVQGEGARGISLQVFNLASKGSRESELQLDFEDGAHNRYALKGKARAGSDAAVDLAITAPSLSLQQTAAMLKMKNPALLQDAAGSLRVNASLHKGEISASGDLAFSGLRLPQAASPPPSKRQRPSLAVRREPPMSGLLHFAGDYSLSKDAARLLDCTLTVDRLLRLHGEGTLRRVRGEREFSLNFAMDEADLGILNSFLSPQARRQLVVAGFVRCDSLHLEGNRGQGLKSAVGTLQLREGTVSREGKLLAAGLAGEVRLSREQGVILAKGRVQLRGRHEKALLEALDLPFSAVLSSKLKPVTVEVPALSATVEGITGTGRVAYDVARNEPVSATVNVSAASVPRLNPLLERYNLRLSAGTAAGTVEFSGKSARDLDGKVKLHFFDMVGTRGKDSFSLKNGSLTGDFQRTAGRLAGEGEAQVKRATWDGKEAEASFGYRVADRTIHIHRAEISALGSRISIARLSGTIAPPGKGEAGGRPFSLQLEGGSWQRGELQVAGVSGTASGSFNRDRSGSWLNGDLRLASTSALWRGREAGSPTIHAIFSRSGVGGEAGGRLFGGRLSGSVSRPSTTQAGASFDLKLAGADLAALAPLLPKGGIHPVAGSFDLQMTGRYSPRDGFACRYTSKGSGVSLAGAGSKTLLSGAGLSIAGSLAAGDLGIEDGTISAEKGVELRLKGKLGSVFTPKRKGTITFSLPQAPLSALSATFLAVLPRFLQEATLRGSAGAEGTVKFEEGTSLLEGGLDLKGARIEVASQRLSIGEIDGRIPLSLDFSGKIQTGPKQSVAFSRDNYPRLLQQMKAAPAKGELVSIDKITFGALELGKTDIRLSANRGVTEIGSLQSSLYGGLLLGKGVLTEKDHLFYRVDLLINGASLRSFCGRFAGIQGYISGKVDGVISISGGPGGLAGITGFTELWAREGAGEKMVVSREFLQRLSKQKLSGFFFRSDRPYDEAEIKATLEGGDLSFDTLKILHTNLFRVRDLNVSIAPTQNRISMSHLLSSIKEAVVRGKPTAGKPPEGGIKGTPAERPSQPPAEPAPSEEFKWEE